MKINKEQYTVEHKIRDIITELLVWDSELLVQKY